MAIKSNTDTVTIEVALEYNSQQAQRIAQQVADFQRAQEQRDARHKQKMEQRDELAAQRRKEIDDRANKQAELRAKAHQARMLSGTKTWSERMVNSIESINSKLKLMAAAFASALLVNGVRNLINDSINLGASINTTAKAIGVTVEELSGLQYAASIVGVPLDAASKTLEKLTTVLAQARAGSSTAAAALQALGISTSSSAKDAVNQMLKLLSATNNNIDRQKVLGQVTAVAGEEGSRALAKISLQVDSIADGTNQARSAGALWTTEMAESANKITDSFQILKNIFTTSFAKGFIGGIDVNGDQEKLREWARNTAEALGSLAANVAELTPAIVKLGTALAGAKLLFWLGGGAIAAYKFATSIDKMALALINLAESGLIGKLSEAERAQAAALKNAITEGTSKLTLKDVYESAAEGLKAYVQQIKAFLLVGGTVVAVGTAIYMVFKVMGEKAEYAAEKLRLIHERQKQLLDDYKAVKDSLKDIIAAEENENRLKKATVSELAAHVKQLSAEKQALLGAIKLRLKYDVASEHNVDTLNALKEKLLQVDSALSTSKGYLKAAQDAKKLADSTKKAKEYVDEIAQADIKELDMSLIPDNYDIPLDAIRSLDQTLTDTFLAFNDNAVSTMNAKKAYDSFAESGKYTADQLKEIAKILNLDIAAAVEKTRQTFGEMVNDLKNGVLALVSAISSYYDALISKERERIGAANEAARERNKAIDDELAMLQKLGLANTTWARRREKEKEDEAKKDSARLRHQQKVAKSLAYGMAVLNIAEGLTNVWTAKPFSLTKALITSAILTATGAVQLATINAQEFATGGMIQGNPYQDKTQVLAQGGEYIVNRQATARNANLLESINNGASFGGGGGITVNINGNVLGEDRWVRDRLLPEINRAVREGHKLANA